jgi:hypothetical protein
MRPVMHVHIASSTDVLASAAMSRDGQDDAAGCGCGHVGACGHGIATAYEALRPRTLRDILDIASGALDESLRFTSDGGYLR